MKILHVLMDPRAEGTPKLVMDWLSVAEYEQETVFLLPEGELKDGFQKRNNWQYYNNEFLPNFRNAFKIVKLIEKICLQRRPDVVISWPMGFSQWIHLGARLAGTKGLIVHAGNPPSRGFRHRYINTYLSFWPGYLMGSKVIACSNYIRNEFSKIPFLSKRQFYSVYNCFISSRFELLDITRSERTAIMVATLEKHKDHETLLRAWSILEKDGYDFRLQIVGSGSLMSYLTKLVLDLELRNVTFLGSRHDIPELLNQSKVFVLSTTEREGFGTVLIEALAAGCKVIATDVPACREVLQNGRYGFLVEQKDEVRLARGIIALMEEPTYEEQQREQKKYVRQFSPEAMVKSYLAISDS